MSTSAATIFILRRRKVGEGEAFTGCGSSPPAAGLYPAYTGVGASIIIDDPVTASYGALIFVVFLDYILPRAGTESTLAGNNN